MRTQSTKKKIAGRLNEARRSLSAAGDAIYALVQHEDSIDARVGALLVAEFFVLVRQFLTSQR